MTTYDAYRGIFSLAWTDFAGYVALCARLRHVSELLRLTVPLDAYFAFAGDALAGELYLFYEPMGGDNHIGYKVRPSLRRRGIASAMTRWAPDARHANADCTKRGSPASTKTTPPQP